MYYSGFQIDAAGAKALLDRPAVKRKHENAISALCAENTALVPSLFPNGAVNPSLFNQSGEGGDVSFSVGLELPPSLLALKPPVSLLAFKTPLSLFAFKN